MGTSRDKETSSGREGILLDDLLDAYVDWRESARAVADAYDRWTLTSGLHRAPRFAAYAATLDQEQKTANAYADAVTDLERCLQHSTLAERDTDDRRASAMDSRSDARATSMRNRSRRNSPTR